MMLSLKSIVTLRRILLGVASVATLLAVFIVEENWRGDRAWAAFEQEMRAKGEPLYFGDLRRSSVPDDQNFFKTPMLARLLYDRPDDAERKKMMQETRLTKMPFGQVRSRKDLPAFSNELKKEGLMPDARTDSAGLDVLRAMRSLETLLDDVRDAAQTRPLASLEPRATPISEGIAADGVFQLGQALNVRAFAELDAGRTSDAFADTIALQHLANALSNQPDTLLNLMIGTAMHGLAAAVVSDGLDEHRWNSTQLARFQESLRKFSPLPSFREGMQKERAMVLYAIDLPSNKELRGAGVPFWLFHGWLQQNKVAYCRDLDATVMSAFTVKPPRVFLSELSSDRASALKSRSPFHIFSRLVIPNAERILESLASSIDRLTLVSTACAIERYRLVNGSYPQTLDELAPAFLPSVPYGVIDGQSARYSQAAQGFFYKLWFVGPNGNDDGGKGDDISFPTTDS